MSNYGLPKRLFVFLWVSNGYTERMFVRKKRNTSGSVSVQIIEKVKGIYKVVRTVGSSKDETEIARLCDRAYHEMPLLRRQFTLNLLPAEDRLVLDALQRISTFDIRVIGPERVFGALFDRMGFGVIGDKLFRHLVIARLAYPASKLKTVDYLYRYRGLVVDKHKLYRSLDTLHNKHKETAERIAYQHTKQTLGGTISVVFYDITTLYFEAEDEDDLRKIGFSKDGKFRHPQIMIGLLVGAGGFPIGYDIFEGNTFEGHTLVPTLEKLSVKYQLGKPIVVADAAMLSKENLQELVQHKYTFIVGGRIRNESGALKAELLKRSTGMRDGDSFEMSRGDGTRLVVTYKDKRAKKDRHNREKGVRKLCERIKSGRLTKEHINNRGYNKFLTLTGEVAVAVDEDKVSQDAQWDGLKGYVTNTDMPAKEVVEHYGNLWQIEKAFRISKTDLRVRPIFHYRKRRIEAHICIAFVAYAIYKELERLLKEYGITMSAKRAAELTHTMYEIHIRLPRSQREEHITPAFSEEQTLLIETIRGKTGRVSR